MTFCCVCLKLYCPHTRSPDKTALLAFFLPIILWMCVSFPTNIAVLFGLIPHFPPYTSISYFFNPGEQVCVEVKFKTCIQEVDGEILACPLANPTGFVLFSSDFPVKCH
jgi:hypothetical protein